MVSMGLTGERTRGRGWDGSGGEVRRREEGYSKGGMDSVWCGVD